jgi:predicted RNase H-like nuclease (RuvC/YqgF family)
LLESDGKGRFSTVKFEDDSVVYSLNVETITDEDAYNDAMNKYYYEQDQYDKKVSDINAKTEVLQAQDRRLQLKLEQLNTEQTALQTEMEACQKVVSKNIEGSFKTFGG